MGDVLDQLKGSVSQPDIEIFKIGPEAVDEFISRLLVVMGAMPNDIRHIMVTHERKKLRIAAVIDKDSEIFSREEEFHSNLSLLGFNQSKELTMNRKAKMALREFGYYYQPDEDEDDGDRGIYLVTLAKSKKSVEIEFDTEVTMAIITNSDFTDQYFSIDASEEVVYKKKYERKKFKGKKKTAVFARVYRSYQADGFYDPEQVQRFHTGEPLDDEDDDDED